MGRGRSGRLLATRSGPVTARIQTTLHRYFKDYITVRLPNFALCPPAAFHLRNMSFTPVALPNIAPALVDPTSNPQMFVIPDLISYCTLDLRVHEELPRAVWESKAWLINGSNISRNEKALNSFHGLKAGGLCTKPPSRSFVRRSHLILPRARLCMLPISAPP